MGNPSNGDNEIAQRIQSLVRRVEQPAPHTRRLLSHLAEIEGALDSGVPRSELAEVFGLSLPQFASALAGARRLSRQGGDGRRASVQSRKRSPTTGPSAGVVPNPEGSLVKKF